MLKKTTVVLLSENTDEYISYTSDFHFLPHVKIENEYNAHQNEEICLSAYDLFCSETRIT